MPSVTVMSKQPPGGRCSLYLRYAETLREALGLTCDVRYCDATAAVPPPAMLICDVLVAPSDGVIVSPDDITRSPSDQLGSAGADELRGLLEQTQERWMAEWANA
jgi:cystathionine gamma-synthase